MHRRVIRSACWSTWHLLGIEWHLESRVRLGGQLPLAARVQLGDEDHHPLAELRLDLPHTHPASQPSALATRAIASWSVATRTSCTLAAARAARMTCAIMGAPSTCRSGLPCSRVDAKRAGMTQSTRGGMPTARRLYEPPTQRAIF